MKQTIKVYKDDFKDFIGLHEASMYFKSNIVEEHKNYFVFEHSDWNNPYNTEIKIDTITFNRIFDMMKNEFSFNDIIRLKDDLRNLKISTEVAWKVIMQKLCYEKMSMNRRIYDN